MGIKIEIIRNEGLEWKIMQERDKKGNDKKKEKLFLENKKTIQERTEQEIKR